jgi:hypothetical protein
VRTFWDGEGGMRGGASVRMEMGRATDARIGEFGIPSQPSTTVIARCHVRVDGFVKNHTGLLTQGVPGSHRTPSHPVEDSLIGSSADRESGIGNAPTLVVPGPLPRL